jgi:hypothetical protein
LDILDILFNHVNPPDMRRSKFVVCFREAPDN